MSEKREMTDDELLLAIVKSTKEGFSPVMQIENYKNLSIIRANYELVQLFIANDWPTYDMDNDKLTNDLYLGDLISKRYVIMSDVIKKLGLLSCKNAVR